MTQIKYSCKRCTDVKLKLVLGTPRDIDYMLVCEECGHIYKTNANPLDPKVHISGFKGEIIPKGRIIPKGSHDAKGYIYSNFIIEIYPNSRSANYIVRD